MSRRRRKRTRRAFDFESRPRRLPRPSVRRFDHSSISNIGLTNDEERRRVPLRRPCFLPRLYGLASYLALLLKERKEDFISNFVIEVQLENIDGDHIYILIMYGFYRRASLLETDIIRWENFVSRYPPVYLSVFLSTYLSACLSACLSECLSVKI